MARTQQLARAGHSVTMFEKNDRMGGLLRYGIPDFKMEMQLVSRHLEQMATRKHVVVIGGTGLDCGGTSIRRPRQVP